MDWLVFVTIYTGCICQRGCGFCVFNEIFNSVLVCYAYGEKTSVSLFHRMHLRPTIWPVWIQGTSAFKREFFPEEKLSKAVKRTFSLVSKQAPL